MLAIALAATPQPTWKTTAWSIAGGTVVTIGINVAHHYIAKHRARKKAKASIERPGAKTAGDGENDKKNANQERR
jgi:hypothetical protein